MSAIVPGPIAPGQSVIGFIGIGTMGLPMALNVVRAGYTLKVFDLSEKALAEAKAAGATPVSSVAELARTSDVIITMLPDAPDVEKIALGEDGIESAARPGTLYVDMSTIDPGTSRRVAAQLAGRGIRMIDSPVARGVENARAGTLALMIGGDKATVDEAMPLLSTMADTITYCGPLGNGVAMKLVNNFLSAGIVSTVAEACAIGLKAGLPLDMIVAISGATGTNNAWMHKLMPSKAFLGDFSPGFMTPLARKDQRLALSFAEDMGVPLTLGKAVFDLLTQTAEVYPREDFTSILRVVGDGAGVKIRLAEADKPAA
ncbi:NAD(P)-dependent oxidoreductase [Chelatococcus asaccharovorans]|uniref:Tartronate semialdehyde reductase n=1 Tax=Chelatococcus asaccharovorans TaxID=28210 RepID=A0A2V3UDU3_9HYPH|nr:NAD(P)-dependent oxidoreductase [Chelatococcus asaccharovorans]MBS7703348.1 NAD(P)-dependent oxidoreductase [Chelatococcus asaccharovorans]PXW61686.1 tartronate semialdehyde reductase [Chelatococcus asaccharovorans]